MFQLSVVTPSGKAFEDQVDSVALPGLLGGLEVYSGHMPIVTALKGGNVVIRKGGQAFKTLTIDSGVVEVDASHNVLVLADQITGGL
jgi:F-type H+-transporting ATPase subunit epsilon